MTLSEYGEFLARSAPAITNEQIEAAARILATVEVGEAA